MADLAMKLEDLAQLWDADGQHADAEHLRRSGPAVIASLTDYAARQGIPATLDGLMSLMPTEGGRAPL